MKLTGGSIDKHFINDAADLVASALRSVPLTNPALKLDEENKIVYSKHNAADTVAIVSGGGAGHEPSFVRYQPHFQAISEYPCVIIATDEMSEKRLLTLGTKTLIAL